MAASVALVVGATFGHQIVDSLLVRLDRARAVHPDESRFGERAQAQVKPLIRLQYRTEGGELVEALVDEERFSAFTRESFALLEQAKRHTLAAVPDRMRAALAPVRAEVDGRVPAYADWYFAWGTGYALIGEAVKSFATHAPAAEVSYVKDMVAADVGAYVRKHYEEIVLYPEKTDRLIADAYRGAHGQTQDEYLRALAELDGRFQALVRENTTHATGTAATPAVSLDWKSQIAKLRLSLHDRGDLKDAVGKTVLVGGGAALGGTVGGALGGTLAVNGVETGAKAPAGRVVARVAESAGSRLFAKLSSPFASRAVSAGGGAVAGGAGGSVAGPVGTVIGVGVGIGVGLAVDYAVNEGLEFVGRPDFLRDTHETVAATFDDWGQGAAAAIRADATVWYDDTIQLLGASPAQWAEAGGAPL